YTDNADKVDQYSTWFDGACPSNVSSDDFTSTDYCDVWTQLKAEVDAVGQVRDLFGNDGLRSIATCPGMTGAVSASHTNGRGEFVGSPTNHVDQNISNWLRLAAGAAGGLAIADPLFGVFAGALNIGATAYAMAAVNRDPVQFETGFDVLLGDTDAYAQTFDT